MPWSPLKYREQIFRLLRQRGYETEVTTLELHKAIMECTHLIREATIKNVIKAFETLENIRQKPNTTGETVWIINYWSNKKELSDDEVYKTFGPVERPKVPKKKKKVKKRG